MRLYFNPMSGCSRRVLAFMGQHGIPFTPVLVDLRAGAHRHPDYLALNPTGRVPTLDTEETGVFWESTAMLRFLAERHAPEALGDTSRARALSDQWTAWAIAHGAPAWSRLNAETGLKQMRGEAPDPAAVQAATDAARRETAILASGLQSDFLAGNKPTIADYTAAGSLDTCTHLARFEVSDARVRQWLDRMLALPGWPAWPAPQGTGGPRG